jgi:hypothetical protein
MAGAEGGAGQNAAAEAFGQAPPSGGESAASAVPNMIGDLFGGRRLYTPVFSLNTVGSVTTATPISRANAIPQGAIQGGSVLTVDVFVNGQRFAAGTPIPAAIAAQLNNPQLFSRIPAGGSSVLPILKIVENENAAPQDRFYLTYNYYNDVDRHLNPAPSQENVNRQILGFEKTFLDANASVGLRLPFYQIYGDDFGNRALLGDLSIILKYALVNNHDTGNVLSGGLVVIVPTGADFVPTGFGSPVIHDTLFQPYLSGIYKFNKDFYAQAFTSIVVPTDGRDSTLFDNDLGIGYFAYRNCGSDATLTYVVPTVEVHVTTPLSHRGALSEPVGVSDLVDITAGSTFGLGHNASLTLGVGIPVVGPRPFDLEAQVFFNWRF